VEEEFEKNDNTKYSTPVFEYYLNTQILRSIEIPISQYLNTSVFKYLTTLITVL